MLKPTAVLPEYPAPEYIDWHAKKELAWTKYSTNSSELKFDGLSMEEIANGTPEYLAKRRLDIDGAKRLLIESGYKVPDEIPELKHV